MNSRLSHWLPWLLLAAAVIATAAVYWPGVTGGWVFDDYPNIVDNAAIHITRGHSTLVAWVNSALSSPSSFLHRPLASLTFSVNWYFGNGAPWPFKVTNIAIHLINGLLVFCMLRALLRLVGWRHRVLLPSPTGSRAGGKGSDLASDPITRGTEPSPPAGHPLPTREEKSAVIDDAAATRLALIVSAAWMLLPINLMAVLYVVQRMESLCQIFVLAGLWAYLHGRWMMLTAESTRSDRWGLALAISGIVLGTMLGLTSKETAVLLPVFAFLSEWILLKFSRSTLHPSPTGRGAGGEGTGLVIPPTETEPSPAPPGHPLPKGEGKSRTDTRIWALFTVTLFIPAVLGFLWLLRGALRPAALAGRDFTLAQRLLTEPRVLVDYLHWTLLPDPMVLSLYHDEIQISTGLLTPWTTLGAILLLAALIVVAIWLRNRRPLVSLGIGWFFAAQLLTATIIPLELVYEQRMYFASIGVLLAAGALLLGLRWKIALPILRGFVVLVALLWFAVATNLRAQEWSNPLRLAVAEANRHPDSARAVYEAGRLLLIASNYQPGKTLDESWKYLRQAAAIPGSSALADQAMIMIADHQREGADDPYWDSMAHKLRDQPTRQEDISALISLTNCYKADICKFDAVQLQRAYEAALSRPHPIARLNGAYADFQRDILHNDKLAEEYLARAVAGDPGESAYRVDLAILYASNGQPEKALEQIDALRRMNLAGRLDRQIATLERLAEQGRAKSH
ncbi:MAG TPA: tetratricopeptide repeat protein [Rhodanobacteraceae bacterium]|nr:tetratricopeptide repeat protein [Rhodanobacteraceae bacterium]